MPEQKQTEKHPPIPSPKRKRKLLRIFGFVFLIGVLLLIAATVAFNIYFTDQRIRKLLIESADTYLQKDALKLDRLKFRIASGLTIEGLSIENQQAAEDGQVLKIEKLVVKYELTSLLLGKLLVKEVVVTNPVLVLSQKDGRWNYHELVPQGGPVSPSQEMTPLGAIRLPLNLDFQKLSMENLQVRLKADPGIEVEITGANINAKGITENFGEKATLAENLSIDRVRFSVASIGGLEFSVQHQLDIECNLVQGDLDRFESTLKLPGFAEQKLNLSAKGFGKSFKLEDFVLETDLADLQERLGPILFKYVDPQIKELNIGGIVKIIAGGDGALAQNLQDSSIHLYGSIETTGDISAASPALGVTGLETKTNYSMNLPLFNPTPNDVEVSGAVSWRKATGFGMATVGTGSVAWQATAKNPTSDLKAKFETDISRIEGNHVQDTETINVTVDGVKSQFEASSASLNTGDLVASAKNSFNHITLSLKGSDGIATVEFDDLTSNFTAKTDIEKLAPQSEFKFTTGKAAVTQKTPTGDAINASADSSETLIQVQMSGLQTGTQEVTVISSIDQLTAIIQNPAGERIEAKAGRTSTELKLKAVDLGQGTIKVEFQNTTTDLSCDTPVAALDALDSEIVLHASSGSLDKLQAGILDISRLQVSVKEFLQTNLTASVNLVEGRIKVDQVVESLTLAGAKRLELKALPLHQHGLDLDGQITGEIHLDGQIPTDAQIQSLQLPINVTVALNAEDLLLGMEGIRTKIGEGSLKFTHSPEQDFQVVISNSNSGISVTSLEALGKLIGQELPKVEIDAKPEVAFQIQGKVPTPQQISELSFDIKLNTELKSSLETTIVNGADRTVFKSNALALKTTLNSGDTGGTELSIQFDTQPNEVEFQLAGKTRRASIPEFRLHVPLRLNLKSKTVDTHNGPVFYKIGTWVSGEIEIGGGLENGVVITQSREIHFQPILDAFGSMIQDVSGIRPAITGSLKDRLRVKFKPGTEADFLKGSEFDASLKVDLDFESLQLNDGKLLDIPNPVHNSFDISVSHKANSPAVKLKYVQTMPQTEFAARSELFSLSADVVGVGNEVDVEFDLDNRVAGFKGKFRKALNDLKVTSGDISGSGKSLLHELRLTGSYDLKKSLATLDAELVNEGKDLEVNAGIKVQIPKVNDTYRVRATHDLTSGNLPVVEIDIDHASLLTVPGLYRGEIPSLKVGVRNTAEAANVFTASVDSKVSNSELTVAESKVKLGDIETKASVESLDVDTGDGRFTSSVSSASFGEKFKVDITAALKKWADTFSMKLKLQSLDIGKVNEDLLKPITEMMGLPFLLSKAGGVVDSEINLSGRTSTPDSKDGLPPRPPLSGNAKVTISDLIVQAGVPNVPTKAALLGDPEGKQTEDAIFGVEDGSLELNLELPEDGEATAIGLTFQSTLTVESSSASITEPVEIKGDISIHGFENPLIQINKFTAVFGDIFKTGLEGKVDPFDLARTFLTLTLELTPEELLGKLQEGLAVGLFGEKPNLDGKVSVNVEARGNPQTNALLLTNAVHVDFPEIGIGALATIQKLKADLTARTSVALEAFKVGSTEVTGSIIAGKSAFLGRSINLAAIEEAKFRAEGSSLAELASSFEIVIFELGYEDPSISLPVYDFEISGAAAIDADNSNLQLDKFTLSILVPPAEEGGDPYEWFKLGPVKGGVKEGGKEVSVSAEGTISDLGEVAYFLGKVLPEVFTGVKVKGDGLSWNVAMNTIHPSEGDTGSNQYRLLKALMGEMPPQLVEKLSARLSLPRHKIDMAPLGVALAADGNFSFDLVKSDLKIDGLLRFDEIRGIEELKVQPTAGLKIDLANLNDLRFETSLTAASGIGANMNGRVSGLEFLYGAGALDTSLANMVEQLGVDIGLELSLSRDQPIEVVPGFTLSGGVAIKGEVKAIRNESLLLNGSAELSAFTLKLSDVLELVGLRGRVPFRKLYRTQTSRQTAQSGTTGLSTELGVEGQNTRVGMPRWRFQKQFDSYRSDIRPLQFEKLAYKGKTIVSDFVMPLSVIDGELRIDSFKMRLLNGDVSASVTVAAVNGTPQLNVIGEFVGIAGGEVSTGKGKDVGGIRGDFNLLLEIDETGKSGGISELRGALHITDIGKKELLRIIDILDPQYAKPDLNSIRTALGIGRPDRAEFKIRHGNLSGKVILSLPIGKSEIPISETPLTQVIRSKSIQKALDKSLESAANLIFLLSAETLIIGDGDQIRIK
ncbi:MAG: hypothetical protein O3B01_24990 [Planctomycetota bacterium]|nr:hypothetical protein [Planctomycetota bacterium]